MTTTPSIEWLSDLNVFSVNRLPAHSDHLYYETFAEAEKKVSMKMRYELNGSWKFHYAGYPEVRPENFFEQDVDCTSWENIIVPGHIQLQGFGKPQYVNTMYPWDGHHDIRPPQIPSNDNPVGSYVKYFNLPDNMKDKPVYISFQGVESAFFVWLNGKFVGYSEDSFTPAEFDVTQFVTDGENKLAVEVYQRSTGSWLEDQDFWRFSGIFRDVYLFTVPKLHIYDLHVQAELDTAYTKGTLKTNLEFLSNQSEANVVVELYDSKGLLVESHSKTTSETKNLLSMVVDKPRLWSAEDPYLYQMYIKVFDQSNNLVEVIPQKVGFRRFELDDKLMKINGKRIMFKGVNRHEFNCRTGRAISKEDMLWDIKTLKRHNINAVRTSHYPNQSYWYELCDEYGIYVIDEMNLETHGSWQKMGDVEPSWNIPGDKEEWNAIVMDRAISMFERDKNHPSILIWSCGNESYAGEVILNVSKYFKKVDPSRLVHYEGVFHNRDYNDTSDMESRMYAKPQDIEKYLKEHPEKPYISCEYMHAMGNSLGGMSKYIDLEKKYPMYQGGFIWDYIDQSIIKKDRYGKEFLAYGGDFGDRPTDYGFCTNGIVYANRKLSPKMQEVKFLYQNLKLIPDQHGVRIINDSLFTPTDLYDLEYTLFFEGKELYRNVVNTIVPPQEEGKVELEWPANIFVASGEYCIQTTFKLKKNTLWANMGYEVAFGQYIFTIPTKKKETTNDQGLLRFVNGDVNIGVHGHDFSAIFSKQVGSLISLQYAGKEIIETPPVPLFWRATTDNDRGFSQHFYSGCWLTASLARKCIGIDVIQEEAHVRITFNYQFSIHEQVRVVTTYTVYPNGDIKVKSDYHGADNLPQMPIFALSFKTSAEYHQLDWYAMGPEENYTDRSQGAKLEIFNNKVNENVSGYVVPQESGNRTGVRWVKVKNSGGQGFKISSVGSPLECNLSPYTALELENAAHHYELPNVHYTVVTVANKQMGVGGDDSWGAPVHKEYLINANENMSFEFMISRLS
jgi:beta-galactosidase